MYVNNSLTVDSTQWKVIGLTVVSFSVKGP